MISKLFNSFFNTTTQILSSAYNRPASTADSVFQASKIFFSDNPLALAVPLQVGGAFLSTHHLITVVKDYLGGQNMNNHKMRSAILSATGAALVGLGFRIVKNTQYNFMLNLGLTTALFTAIYHAVPLNPNPSTNPDKSISYKKPTLENRQSSPISSKWDFYSRLCLQILGLTAAGLGAYYAYSNYFEFWKEKTMTIFSTSSFSNQIMLKDHNQNHNIEKKADFAVPIEKKADPAVPIDCKTLTSPVEKLECWLERNLIQNGKRGLSRMDDRCIRLIDINNFSGETTSISEGSDHELRRTNFTEVLYKLVKDGKINYFYRTIRGMMYLCITDKAYDTTTSNPPPVVYFCSAEEYINFYEKGIISKLCPAN